jgi:hypothetical protein
LAQKIQQIAIRKKIADAAIARHNAEQEKSEKEKKQGVAEAKADPLGSWISHKEFTDPKIFKTREGAKAHAEKTGGTVNSSEGYHKLKKEKKQGVVESGPFSYGAKPPRKGSVASYAALKRKEQDKNRKPIEPKDQMVGVARIIKDISMSDASSEHKKVAIDALNKKRVSEEGGAGEFGTAELTKKYAKDTPGQCQEILNMNTADMGDVIKDFKKSDAPQFKGKSVEKRRQMAIAAKLSSQDKE